MPIGLKHLVWLLIIGVSLGGCVTSPGTALFLWEVAGRPLARQMLQKMTPRAQPDANDLAAERPESCAQKSVKGSNRPPLKDAKITAGDEQ